MEPQNSGRVVLVDDELQFTKLLDQYLSRSFDVTAFSDPEEALDHLKDNPAKLLITDLVMPNLDGLELITAVKEHQPAIYAILISGTEPEWDQLPEGVDLFLAKPLSLKELRETCQEYLDR
jgi:DNA-binding NtrC family response regulator